MLCPTGLRSPTSPPFLVNTVHTCFACLLLLILQLLLLENVRFYKEEEKNEADFAKKVCAWVLRKEGLRRLWLGLGGADGQFHTTGPVISSNISSSR